MADEAFRLVFRHDAKGVTLKSAERVEMRVPPSDAPARGFPPGTVGTFAELRSREGRTLFTRSLAEDDSRLLEYPTGYPDEPFRRAHAPGPAFVAVLLPADRDAVDVALVRADVRPLFHIPFLPPRPRRRIIGIFGLPGREEE